MKILVTGGHGQVGTAFSFLAGKRHFVMSPPRDQLDIGNKEQAERVIKTNSPDIVINTAAYTAVDNAENEREQAFKVNQEGSENLASVCAELDIPLIHISTDYVFDGNKASPYNENDPVQPINIYGSSKAAGETAIRKIAPKHIILRTAWVFGTVGSNFVKLMIGLRGYDRLKIVSDQTGGPTSALDVASAILSITEAIEIKPDQYWGTYHFCGAPGTSRYQFAKEIFQAISSIVTKTPVLEPIESKDYPSPAVRPKNTMLDCKKILQVFDIHQPDWRVSLEKVIMQLNIRSNEK